MDDRRSRELEEKAREVYRRRAEDLPPQVTRRLAAARREALTRAGRRHWSPVWAPAGAIAAGVVAIAVFQVRGPGAGYDDVVSLGPVAEDMEILFGEEDLDLLENLDFYAWLGTEADTG